MATYKTPGVYIEETNPLQATVVEVQTAIPAFFGFTEKGNKNVPVRITSLAEYQTHFGGADPEKNVVVNVQGSAVTVSLPQPASPYVLFYAMQLYFANGGGACYVVSTGNFAVDAAAQFEAYSTALAAVAKEDEPTLLVFPDAPFVMPQRYYELVQLALQQCRNLGDRFVIIDVLAGKDITSAKDNFRTDLNVAPELAKYGAAYYPYLQTSISFAYDKSSLMITGSQTSIPDPNLIELKIAELGVVLTPCAAVAGVYAQVDATRGVWKAPANVALSSVKAAAVKVSNSEQEALNVDVPGGKSINAIREFPGRGILVWGARTLAGNDNEWRYVNVRRFFNMVEESIRKSTAWAVFEPNDLNTWTKVRAMIENYLFLKWKEGALAGAKPDQAFYVQAGLGQTMTALDISEGRMHIHIGLAVLRPAEFIMLRVTHHRNSEG
jgi:uncharacterized protein